jgi:hypothetical protein
MAAISLIAGSNPGEIRIIVDVIFKTYRTQINLYILFQIVHTKLCVGELMVRAVAPTFLSG